MLDQIYMLDYVLLAVALVLLVFITKFGPRFVMNKYFVKYVLLAEQIYFVPSDGKTRYAFVKNHIAEIIGKKSFLLRKIFEIALDEKTIHKFIEDTVKKNRVELDLIKESNAEIVNTSAQVFENKLLKVLPDKPEVVKVVQEVKEKNFNSDNSISAFAELRTDFRKETELRAGASVNIKL